MEDVHGSVVLSDYKCMNDTFRENCSPEQPFKMLNHCTLETEIKSFVPRAISPLLFPELNLLCNSFFGELCSVEMFHVAVLLPCLSNQRLSESNLAFGKQPR